MSYLGRVTNKSSDIRRIDITSSTSATHTLTWTAPNEQSLIVTINGVKQQNNYTVSGTTLTLDTALISTDKLEVIGINDIGTTITPAEGSVNTSQLANDAVSTAKIQDDAVTADKLANAINTSIAANTAKVTNATHTGDVTGATALTIAVDAVDIAMLSATGTASSSTFLRGDNAWSSAAAGLNSVQTFTSSGTWTRPAGITKVIMEVQGAGGGGGHDATLVYCRNGGGGGYAKKFLDVSSITSSTITVGTGGVGIVSAGTPTAGGDSSWADGANTITGGGSPASNNSSSASGFRGGAGGVASGGDINIDGGGSFSDVSDSGSFGMSVLGQEGYGLSASVTYQATTAEMNGVGYGGGGGGRVSGSASPTSGAGANGVVIVWEYK